jgi:hypothetical protein
MPYQGVWESQAQGEGRQGVQEIVQGTMRYEPASVFNHKRTGKPLETGEPCAVKAARTVRGGAVRNGLSDEPTRKDSGKSKALTVPRWPPTLLREELQLQSGLLFSYQTA